MTDKSVRYIEIADKNNKIKIEVNAFLSKAIKEISKKSPETLKTLREQIDDLLKSETERLKNEGPKINETFTDSLGRSYKLVAKNTIADEKTLTLQRGNLEYKVKITDAYEKNGKKKVIDEKKLKENEIEVLF